jgi:hypothetical protein
LGGAGELYGYYCDVVVLTEGSCCFGYLGGGVAADGAGAVETEEFAGAGLGFYYSVGDEG